MAEKLLHAGAQGAAKSSLYQAKQGLSKEHARAGFESFNLVRFGSNQKLCKDERLSREILLDKLFKEGKSVSQNGFTLVYLNTPLPAIYPAQAAFSVPKRYFKKATHRNTIKRYLREAYRKNKLPLYQKLVTEKQQLALMLIYKHPQLPDYNHVVVNVTTLITKLIERLKFS